MRIDSIDWRSSKRICISIDDDLFLAFSKFSKKSPDFTRDIFRKKIYNGEIKNSSDAKLFIYSQLMKPSAYRCFSGAVPEQVDLEDL